MFQNEAAAPAQQAEVIRLSSANTPQASTYQAEQFADLSDAFSEQWVAAATADSESVEIVRLDDLMATVQKLTEAIKARQVELSAKAKEKQAVNKLKELLESGVTDPVKLREAIDAMHPVPEKTASRSRNNAPKVYKFFLKDEHADAKDENGKPLAKAYARDVGGIADDTRYRAATDAEIKSQQKDLEAWKASNPKS